MLFSGIDSNKNDAVEVCEFVDWVFGADPESIGRKAVEAAKQATLAACETVPSAISRIGSTLGDIRVTVNDIGGNPILPDFGLFPGDTMLILRHASESAMTKELGYRCKLLLGEKSLADEDTVSGSGLETGSVLTAVLTFDPMLLDLIEKLPKLAQLAREDRGNSLEDKSDDEIEKIGQEALAVLRQVDELGCFGLPTLPKGDKLWDPPNAGQRGIPGWSGRDVLGPVVPIFGTWLQDASPGVRELACWCLSRAGVDAIPFLPHLAAAAWDTRYSEVCSQAASALCLLASQAPQQVVPVLVELVCHDFPGVTRGVMNWLTYAGQSILFWRPMPGAKEMAQNGIKQAFSLASKERGEPVPTAYVAASIIKRRYPNLVESLKEKAHPTLLKRLEENSDDEEEDNSDRQCPCWNFCGVQYDDEGEEARGLQTYVPASIGSLAYGEEEE